MAFCSECGKPVSDGAKFCAHCGHPTGALGAARPAPQAPAAQSYRPSPSATAAADPSPTVRARLSQALLIVAQPLLADLQKCLTQWRLTPLALASGPDVTTLRSRARSELNRHKGRIRYVCIIGDWDAVPPYEIPNPTYSPDGDGDQDEICFTDAPYAGAAESTDQGHPDRLIPELPLGRIPVMNMQVIERCLLEGFPKAKPSEAFAFSMTAKVWSRASQEIIRQAFPAKQVTNYLPAQTWAPGSTPLLTTPEWDEEALASALQDQPIAAGSIIHFNVHGGLDDPEWVGQEGFRSPCIPTIFSPQTVADYRGAFLLSEACYGGNMNYDGQRSIVQEFFMRGGLGFVGCSVIAYGNCTENISAADVIAAQFFKSVQQGMSFGAALSAAKVVVMASGTPSTYLMNLKTIASFNLYGAPWHAMQVERSAAARPSDASAGAGGRALDRVRNRLASVGSDESNPDDDSLLSQIRQQYKERIKVPLSWNRLKPQATQLNLEQIMSDPEVADWIADDDWSLDDLTLQFFEFDDGESYLLHAKRHTPQKPALVLALDAQGKLQQVITSKHWSRS